MEQDNDLITWKVQDTEWVPKAISKIAQLNNITNVVVKIQIMHMANLDKETKIEIQLSLSKDKIVNNIKYLLKY